MKTNKYLRMALCLLTGACLSVNLLSGTGTLTKYAASGQGVARARYAAWDPDIRWHRLAGAWNYNTSNTAHGYDLPYNKKDPASWPGGTTYTKGWTDFTWILRTDGGGGVSTGTGPGSIDTGRAPTHLYNGGTEVSTKFFFWKQLKRGADVTAGTGSSDVFHSSMINASANGPAFYRLSEKMAATVSPLQHFEDGKITFQNDAVTWFKAVVPLPNTDTQILDYNTQFPGSGWQAPTGGNAMREDYPKFNKIYVRSDYAEAGNNQAAWSGPGTNRTVNVQFYETVEYCWQAEQVD